MPDVSDRLCKRDRLGVTPKNLSTLYKITRPIFIAAQYSIHHRHELHFPGRPLARVESSDLRRKSLLFTPNFYNWSYNVLLINRELLCTVVYTGTPHTHRRSTPHETSVSPSSPRSTVYERESSPETGKRRKSSHTPNLLPTKLLK